MTLTTVPETATHHDKPTQSQNRNRDRPGRRRLRTRTIGVKRAGVFTYIFLSLVVILSIFPLYWSYLIGSGNAQTIHDPHRSWLPGPNFLDHVSQVVSNTAINFWKALGNSIVVSVVVSASVVFFATLAGYAFAKFKFKGSGWMLTFVVATIAIPTQLGVVPMFIVMSKFGWTGTLGAVIVPNLVTAFGVFWMTQFIRQTVPDELMESARMDGASTFRTFRSIVLPVIKPAASMLALFTFVATWTDFFWPFIVLNGSNPTLPVALQLLQANYFVDYSIVLAGALVATVPLLLLFALAGKQLVEGVMQGAVKG